VVNSHNYKEPPMNQFEKLIEYIINEQEDKARELFHQIVVEKSRSIYENLIDEVSPHGESNGVDDLVDEISNDHLGMSEEQDEEEGEMEMPSSDSDSGEENPFGDEEGGEEGSEGGEENPFGGEEGEEDLSNRVMGLEAELDELQAKFDKIIAGEENEEDGEPGVHGDVSMHSMHGPDDSELMEYVIPVKDGHGAEKKGGSEGKLIGSSGGSTPVNSKSLNQPKNNMGGTNKNIAQGGSEAAPEGKAYTKPNNAYSKGATENDIAKRNVNIPGGNGANKFFNKNETSYEKNHGKEGQTTDGSVPVAKGSVVAESRKVARKTTR